MFWVKASLVSSSILLFLCKVLYSVVLSVLLAYLDVVLSRPIVILEDFVQVGAQGKKKSVWVMIEMMQAWHVLLVTITILVMLVKDLLSRVLTSYLHLQGASDRSDKKLETIRY